MLDHQQLFWKSLSTVRYKGIISGHEVNGPIDALCMCDILSLSLLLCLDMIQSVLIMPPIQASGNGSVPTGISLVFRANKTTQYYTGIVEPVTYRWSFGDGSQTEDTIEPIISHVFYTPGNYNISLSVSPSHSQPTQTTYTITVYESKAPPITPPIMLL